VGVGTSNLYTGSFYPAVLETERWRGLLGHETGNDGYRQTQPCTLPRQCSTLPKKIAVQLANSRLEGIFVPSEEREAKRNVCGLWTNFWQYHTRVGIQLKNLLFTQGLIDGNDKTRICQKWITQKLSEIEKGKYPRDFYYTVKKYAQERKELTEKMKEIEQRLKIQAKSEPTIHKIYESVPGIGLIHARELANELGDMKQFRNEKKLFSYTGLTPSEYSSGEHIRQGHISRQERSVLRKILIEASWVAITKDPSLREVYNRLFHRGGKRAIVGVARRLVGRIRSCLLSGTLYEMGSKKEENVVQKMICTTS
jgi:hypothetical protein